MICEPLDTRPVRSCKLITLREWVFDRGEEHDGVLKEEHDGVLKVALAVARIGHVRGSLEDQRSEDVRDRDRRRTAWQISSRALTVRRRA